MKRKIELSSFGRQGAHFNKANLKLFISETTKRNKVDELASPQEPINSAVKERTEVERVAQHPLNAIIPHTGA